MERTLLMESYLQSTDQIEILEAGILHNLLEFDDGEPLRFTYDFTNPAHSTLAERYSLHQIAGNGTAFERALRLMAAFSPRLRHDSYFAGGVELSALSLLEYSLDQPRQGINCRCKAQILNEMCLTMGIFSRKVWLHPCSVYDHDCHVVNEIWDERLHKWIMLDITSNTYWIDEYGLPLSILEIREKGALRQFCTPVMPCDALSAPQEVKQKNIGGFLYIMKNMAYIKYVLHNTVGENGSECMLCPKNYAPPYPRPKIALSACQEPPQ